MGAAACSCNRREDGGDDEEESSVVADNSKSLRHAVDTPEKAMLAAAKVGDLDKVKALLKDGVSIKSTDKRNRNALHLAAISGKLELGTFLVKKGAKKEAEDDYGRTPLICAVEKGHLEFANLLLLKGAIRGRLDDRLIEAARKGHTPLCKDLLTCSAKICCKNENGHTPLHQASYHGHVDCVRLLLDSGAKHATKSKHGSTALNGASQNGHVDVVRLLVDHGARLDRSDKHQLGKKLLAAVENNDIDMGRQLLIYDASTKEKDKCGRNALVLAAERGHVEIGALLASRGVSGSAKESLGKLFLKAAGDGVIEHVKLLMQCYADVETKDYFNETPLWKASMTGQTGVVRLLLDKSARLEVKSRNCCRSPLGIAIDKGHLETSRLLLDRGAVPPDSALLGRKLRDASKTGDVDRVQTLLQLRAHVDAVDQGCETPLHNAATSNKFEVVKILLDSSANLDAKSGSPGRTALYYAAVAGSVESVQVLMERAKKTGGEYDVEGFEKATSLLRTSGAKSLLTNSGAKR